MKTRGFTLIELVVAIGIFAVMLLVIVGVFSRFMTIQRRDIGEQHLQEDLRLALELFNKEARTGYGNTYPEGLHNEIVFRNQNNVCVKYRLKDGRIKRSAIDLTTSPQGSGGCDPSWGYGDEMAITGPETVVNSLGFYAVAAQVDPATGRLISQGVVEIVIKAHPKQKEDSIINFQSAVSSRQFFPASVL